MRKLIFASLLLVAVSFAGLSSQASALSGGEFQAGRIIDDGVFFNGNSLNTSDIQAFLNSKVPSCDTNGSKPYGNTTRAAYGASKGYPAPYTCLKDYSQNTPTKAAEAGLCNQYNGGTKTAAQIIRDVGQACGVSQKALIILLEKEQSLITDDWPWSIQYRSATGYGCPDTAPCDSEYYGFFNQVYNAARQFKRYAKDSTLFRYRAYRDNYIQYNPNAGCGGSNILVQTQATAGLYNFTPYQPNHAALVNLYGTGDDCSAYGNRNFWRIFNDWFGSTFNPNYAWDAVSQELYTDSARTKTIEPTTLAPNTTYYVRIKAKNLGNIAWSNSGPGVINLATSNPGDRNSSFCDSSWLRCNRPASLKETTVAPGGVGTFEFSIKSPSSQGNFNEYFRLLSEGRAWMNDIGMYLPLYVKPPTYTWGFVSQNLYADGGRTKNIDPTTLAPNTTYYVRIKAKNLGNVTWTNSGAGVVNLGTSSPGDRNSSFCDSSWLRCNRAATLKEATVAPGDTGTFEFSIKSPSTQGNFNEYFRPLSEGRTWMNDLGLYLPLHVKPPTYTWAFVSQNSYTDQTKSTPANIGNVKGGTRVFTSIRAKNTGNATWTNSGSGKINLGTSNPGDRISEFCDNTWISCNRPTSLKETSVAPGDVGTFDFWMTVPYKNKGTSMSEYFRPVSEGRTWMNDLGLFLKYTINSNDDEWQYIGQTISMSSGHTIAANPSSLQRNTTYYLQLKLRNTSGQTWTKGKLNLGTSNPVDRQDPFCNNTWILQCTRATTLKENSVAPGQTGTLEFSIKTNNTPGNYQAHFRPVLEGQTWLKDVGLYWGFTVL